MAQRVPLSEAALRLGLTYHQVRQLLFRGEVQGGRDRFGRFYVDAEALDALAPAERPKTEPVGT